ncbi:MAG TPA: hypothetical protein VGV38_17785 [Pyrinomonadaceae bacterium]|nr:hypothetical protein [Pyrinomonadaceae bacterium]
MRSHTRVLRIAARASLAFVAFALLSPCAARAQSSQSARDARRIEMENRQRALRDLERVNEKPQAKRADHRPLYREVAKDFEQLQLSNHSLSKAATAEGPPDFALMKKEAAEVRKRASRLKANLALPKTEETRRREGVEELLTPEGLRPAVAALDTLVNGFVWNPVFRQPDVVDLEQSSKASRDLSEIIALSERIRKCVEGLGGAALKEKE